MSLASSAFVALSAYLFIVLFGRSLLQYTRTGAFGFHGIQGATGSLSWWAGVTMVIGMLGLLVIPAAAWLSIFSVSSTEDQPSALAAWFLFAAGFTMTVLAQLQMGDSWRIGVREGEQTELKSRGFFAWCRNPIFTGMLLTSSAVVLWFPTIATAGFWIMLLLALEVQVRHIEEPHLQRVHGETYLRYAKQTGRFIPGFGKGTRVTMRS